MREPVLVGLFVGGLGSRMGGAVKPLLAAPDRTPRTLLARLESELDTLAASRDDVDLRARVFAGTAHERTLRAHGFTHPCLADAPPGVGPMGGLRALCREALRSTRSASPTRLLAIAGDLPHVGAAQLSTLLDAPRSCAAFAPRHDDGTWEPLVALYDPARTLPAIDAALARGRHSLQALLDALDAHALPIDDALAHALRDWDTPEDRARDGMTDNVTTLLTEKSQTNS